MNADTHSIVNSSVELLGGLARRIRSQIDAETPPMWRNLLEHAAAQIAIASTVTGHLSELLPPRFGGDSPDPWEAPLRDHNLSLEVLTVFQAAQRRGIKIRSKSFDEHRRPW